MDMAFAVQGLSARYIMDNADRLSNKLYQIPKEIDNWVATLKLKSLGITIDQLTEKQHSYLQGWQE